MSSTDQEKNVDPTELRQQIRNRWGKAAEGWYSRRDSVRANTMPVSAWLVDAISPQPGNVILDLAAGIGDTGFLAAEFITPGGELITSDVSPEMLSAAQLRANELEITNVRFRQINAESIDLPTASIDAVLCRWGFMLMIDPSAALRETRRILKPGGTLALAAWADSDNNKWSTIPNQSQLLRDKLETIKGDQPGPFTWHRPGLISQLLVDAGFEDITVEPLDFEMKYLSFQDWWDTSLAMGRLLSTAVAELDEKGVEQLSAELEDLSSQFRRANGELAFPAQTWVASAKAPG